MLLDKSHKDISFSICRYALGTDKKLYQQFLESNSQTHANLGNIVKKHRFRQMKPFYVQKPEQQ
jgi:hypothetical protein